MGLSINRSTAMGIGCSQETNNHCFCSGYIFIFLYQLVLSLLVAPIKALCSERHQDWSNKFGAFGLTCTELTGDTDLDDFQVLQSSHIVLTTPVSRPLITGQYTVNRFKGLEQALLINDLNFKLVIYFNHCKLFIHCTYKYKLSI